MGRTLSQDSSRYLVRRRREERKRVREGGREGGEVMIHDKEAVAAGTKKSSEGKATDTSKRTVGPGPRTQADDDPKVAAGLVASFPCLWVMGQG
jgi:hypothetical protein